MSDAADGASFVIDLVDKVTQAALGASHALEQLEQRLHAVAGASGQADQGLNRVASAADKVGSSHKQASGATDEMKGKTEELGGASEETAGALEAAGGAALGVAAAAVAAVVAVGALVVKMAELSFAATEAKENQIGLAFAETGDMESAEAMVAAQYRMANSSALTQEKFFGLSNAILRAGVSANQFQDTLRALSDVSSVAGEQAVKPIEKVLKKVEQLGEFKVKDTDLKGSGIKMAEVYERLSQDLGMSVDQIKTKIKLGQVTAEEGIQAMNEALEKKFGAAAKLKVLDFGVQMDHLKTNIVNLFSDVDAKPFLQALQNVLSLFDANTAAGGRLKSGVTEVMNTIFKVGAQVVYGLEAFFLGFELAVLKVYIAVHPLINVLRRALHMDGNGTKGAFESIAAAGEKVGFVVAFVLTGVLELAIGIAYVAKAASWVAEQVGGWGNLGAIIVSLIPGVGAVAAGIYFLVQIVSSAYTIATSSFRGIATAIAAAFHKASSLGSDLIDGLIAGIEAGAARVAAAVTGVAKGAIDAGKHALGIASPSRVFREEVGHQVGAGMAGGIDDSRAVVTASMRSLVALPPGLAANDNAGPRRQAVAREGQAGRSSSGGGRAFHLHAGAVTINVKSSDPKTAAKEMHAELNRLLEDLAAQAGGESDEGLEEAA